MGKCIAITGASGTLGLEIISRLSKCVDVLVAFTSSEKGVCDAADDASQIVAVPRDAFDVFEQYHIDCVVNCAFPRSDAGDDLAKGMRYSADLFEAIEKNKVGALINVSSQSVYSQSRIGSTDESEPICPEGRYAMGKYSVELLADHIVRNVPLAHVRLASLIGVGYDERFISYFIRKILSNERFTAKQGSSRYGFMDVRDAATAITVMSLSSPSEWKRLYNLGPACGGYSMDEIVNAIRVVSLKYGYNPKYNLTRDDALRGSGLSSKRFESDFDWHSGFTLVETVDWIMRYYLHARNL